MFNRICTNDAHRDISNLYMCCVRNILIGTQGDLCKGKNQVLKNKIKSCLLFIWNFKFFCGNLAICSFKSITFNENIDSSTNMCTFLYNQMYYRLLWRNNNNNNSQRLEQ